MDKQVVCQYCGKVFYEKDYEYGDEYLKECAIHEVSHLNLEEKFKDKLEDAINILDKKYKSDTKLIKLNINTIYDESYYGTYIEYKINIKINNINKQSIIEVQFEDKENIPTIKDIVDNLEKHYKSEIDKEYIGNVLYEEYCGGEGADDYMIGNQYVRDIFKQLKGKKVILKVIE